MRGNLLPNAGRAGLALLLLAAVMSLAAACGGGGSTKVAPEPDPDPGPGQNAEPGVVSEPPEGATQVGVRLLEWTVAPDVNSAPAGEVYFLADNVGGEAHEFVVIKTDLDPAGLPVVDGKVQEDQVEILGEIEPFANGSQASMALNLEPGSYALICNIVEEESGGNMESHYVEGMHTAFTVE